MEAVPIRDERVDVDVDLHEAPLDEPIRQADDSLPPTPILTFRRRAMFSARTGHWHTPSDDAETTKVPSEPAGG